MKLTKQQLTQLIKEELEAPGTDQPLTVSVELTQKEASAILIALEGRMGDKGIRADGETPENAAYNKIFHAGIDGGFGARQ
jgi:ABC-type arginine transport system ATPase subunit